MKKFNRPRASTIGTPVYHRRRRDWKDDRDLLEEVAASVNRLDGPYDYYDRGVFTYREKIKAFRESGYENNKEVFYLGMWIREALSEISKTQASYDLRVHPISFPENRKRQFRKWRAKLKVFQMVKKSRYLLSLYFQTLIFEVMLERECKFFIMVI